MNRVKSSSAYKIYQDGGLESLLTAVWIYTLQNTVLADGLKKVLSESRHEQIIAFPSIGYWPQIETPRSFNEKIMHRIRLSTSARSNMELSTMHCSTPCGIPGAKSAGLSLSIWVISNRLPRITPYNSGIAKRQEHRSKTVARANGT